jgi:hypothetical protein
VGRGPAREGQPPLVRADERAPGSSLVDGEGLDGVVGAGYPA